MKLPDRYFFLDKDGSERRELRIKWWENPLEQTYHSIAIHTGAHVPHHPVIVEDSVNYYYKADEKIVFFGHYWLQGNPSFYRSNICCLDYSIARGGKLLAYRYDGEKVLDENKLVFV